MALGLSMYKTIVEYVDELLSDYHARMRHPDLEPLVRSELVCARRTHELKWPGSNRPGVYLFFDESKETVLYVGRACERVSTRLNNRLVSSGLEPIDPSDWGARARHVATIGVAEWHEVLSLEAFLIHQIDSPGNTHWRPTRDELDYRKWKLRNCEPEGWYQVEAGRLEHCTLNVGLSRRTARIEK
jgi:hypothetical protein